MSEILGSLFKYLLAAVGVGAVVTIVYAAFGASKTQNTIAQITQLEQNIHGLYKGHNNLNSLTNEVVVSAKLAPSDMVANDTLTNAWNGTPTVGSDASSGGFFIQQTNLPNDACAKVATGVRSYLSVQINGGTVYSATAPLDPGAAALACNSGTNSNTVKFVFGRA